MSRYHPRYDISQIFNAAEYWKEHALKDGYSVLSGKPLWNAENIEQLNIHFLQNIDEGEGKYLEKLEYQLREASPGAIQLAAEMHWLMMLCPSNIKANHKVHLVSSIWGWSGEMLNVDSPYLEDDVLIGAGSAGPGYNNYRWREFRFFIQFAQRMDALDASARQSLLSDPWAFDDQVTALPEGESRQLRHMLLFLLFPDSFERTFGQTHRRKIVAAFTERTLPQVRKLSPVEIDRELLAIRNAQSEKLGTEELDFYEPPLLEQWDKAAGPGAGKEGPSEFDEHTRNIKRSHVLLALKQIDQEEVPPDASSDTYDLIYSSHRYPPKYVLSLAAKFANGEIFPRTSFTGGEASKAFKFLRDLGFHIERKAFLSEYLKKFIEQADEGTDLHYADYPTEYRGLRVKPGFGQGVATHVPWISFTGYEQVTSEGIYPVLLYYKANGVLIVAYGISETRPPKFDWANSEGLQTITSYLDDNYQATPPRYGASFVHTAFDVSEVLDEAGIELALDDLIGRYHAQFEGEQPDPVGEDEPYPVEEALDGLFVEEQKFRELLNLLKQKRNVIVQGPPGVGKTFVCKRLAYALLEEKVPERVQMVQFHQNYSYEDFIQGYRPSGQGFRLKDGVFHKFCQTARDDPANDYVFIIDELNRGNLSKVFGELMLLIESDKRGPEWAMPLTYSEDGDEPFYIPENLYLIGLMNTADRSLAMVDYALRRRFAFAELVPGFDTDEFRNFLEEKGSEPNFVEHIIGRMGELNSKIADDTTNLGRGYCIGHSFFCAIPDGEEPNWAWYNRVISTEIEPLIREYYFDDYKQANALVEMLLRPE